MPIEDPDPPSLCLLETFIVFCVPLFMQVLQFFREVPLSSAVLGCSSGSTTPSRLKFYNEVPLWLFLPMVLPDICLAVFVSSVRSLHIPILLVFL